MRHTFAVPIRYHFRPALVRLIKKENMECLALTVCVIVYSKQFVTHARATTAIAGLDVNGKNVDGITNGLLGRSTNTR